MKKFRDKRKFNDVVNTIARAEKDVDNVLKAARLERYPQSRIDSDDKFLLLLIIVTFLFILGVMWISK